MRPVDYPQALMRAAEPVLRVIEADKRRAPRRLRPIFDKLVELLFEPGLVLQELQQEAGFDDPEVFADLRSELGQQPWTYFRDFRLETAAGRRAGRTSRPSTSSLSRPPPRGWTSPASTPPTASCGGWNGNGGRSGRSSWLQPPQKPRFRRDSRILIDDPRPRL